jgi:hypothetical protein
MLIDQTGTAGNGFGFKFVAKVTFLSLARRANRIW